MKELFQTPACEIYLDRHTRAFGLPYIPPSGPRIGVKQGIRFEAERYDDTVSLDVRITEEWDELLLK